MAVTASSSEAEAEGLASCGCTDGLLDGGWTSRTTIERARFQPPNDCRVIAVLQESCLFETETQSGVGGCGGADATRRGPATPEAAEASGRWRSGVVRSAFCGDAFVSTVTELAASHPPAAVREEQVLVIPFAEGGRDGMFVEEEEEEGEEESTAKLNAPSRNNASW